MAYSSSAPDSTPASASSPLPFPWPPQWKSEEVEAVLNPLLNPLLNPQEWAQQWPGAQEILALRQVHALEHATVWVLSNHPEVLGYASASRVGQRTVIPLQDDGRLSGLSTHYGFYLYGPVSTARIKWAANAALDRLLAGDVHLAQHPRCGTNLLVHLLVTTGLAVGVSSLMPKRPLEQWAGLGLAAAAAKLLTPDLGHWCQEHLTTALPENLRIIQVSETLDFWGKPAHFVRTQWLNS